MARTSKQKQDDDTKAKGSDEAAQQPESGRNPGPPDTGDTPQNYDARGDSHPLPTDDDDQNQEPDQGDPSSSDDDLAAVSKGAHAVMEHLDTALQQIALSTTPTEPIKAAQAALASEVLAPLQSIMQRPKDA